MVTGIYHKTNVLKFRILYAAFNAGKPLTCREIASRLDVPLVNVSAIMNHYQKQTEHKYFRRLKPIKGKAYRYKLTKNGAKYLVKYCWRLHEGFSLSLYKVKKMPKRDRVIAERNAEAELRNTIFEKTGVEMARKPKPTVKELLNFDPADLIDYMGITKRGALEMGIIGLDFEV